MTPKQIIKRMRVIKRQYAAFCKALKTSHVELKAIDAAVLALEGISEPDREMISKLCVEILALVNKIKE